MLMMMSWSLSRIHQHNTYFCRNVCSARFGVIECNSAPFTTKLQKPSRTTRSVGWTAWRCGLGWGTCLPLSGLVVVGPWMRMVSDDWHPQEAVVPCKEWKSLNLSAQLQRSWNPKMQLSEKVQVQPRMLRFPVASAEGLKPNLFKRHNLVKQSGVPGVKWNSTCFAWEVPIPKYDSKGKRKGNTNRKFSISKFMVNGRNEAEADAAALEAAKAFHAELVRKGILEEPKERDPNFTSEVPGVTWSKESKKWRVRISLKQINQKEPRKKISGGVFMEKAAAEAEALRLQELHGLQRKVKAVSTLSALPVFEPKVPYRGVNWNQGEQQWHACCSVGGLTRNFRVKPKDHSEAELERSFQVAVAWRKRQEKENQKMAKSKPKPQKKHRKCKNHKSWVANIQGCEESCLLEFRKCFKHAGPSYDRIPQKRQPAASHPYQ